ncbi:MAG: RluA family pseudouridine synthase [Gammaproteobacteria bacterium]|jgi:23S rRNA pseudouridine955/2504/2580 synthase
MDNLRKARNSASGQVEYVTVGAEEAGQRLDNFLMARLRGVPRTRVYRMLRKGEVRVNKGRAAPSYRIRHGDVVRIPPVRQSAPRQDAGRPPQGIARLEERILYEDERLLVLDKPSGMAVHGGSGASFGVIETLRAIRPDAPYLELVHRLDKETSGCLLIAKRRSYLRSLHELLREGRLDKRYLALVRGQWHLGSRRLEDRLRTHHREGGERHVKADEHGKIAVSRFTPVQILRSASLVEVQLFTGRTHQIRVQAAAAGHPLAGDRKYGDADFNRHLAKLGLKRMFLHAHSLEYDDPRTGEPRSFSSPLPDDLRAVLEAVERWRA